MTYANLPTGKTAVEDSDGEQLEIDSNGALTANTIPNRPSQGVNRTHIVASLADQTADGTIHTVTSGKTFFVHSVVISAFNTATGSFGDIRLRQGEGGTDKMNWLINKAGISGSLTSAPLQGTHVNLVEPLQFASGTAVRLEIVSGTIRYSITLIGYEETN